MDVMSSCCCCLRSDPDKDLSTPYTHHGKTEIYSNMLLECFDLKIPLDDGETGICWVCVDRLRDATDFKQQVQRSQTELSRLRVSRAQDLKTEVKSEVVDDTEEVIKEDPPVPPESDVQTGLESNLVDDNQDVNEVQPVPLASEAVVKSENVADDDDVVMEDQHEPQESDEVPTPKPEAPSDDVDMSNTDDPFTISTAVDLTGAVGAGQDTTPESARLHHALACCVRLERLLGREAPHLRQRSPPTSRLALLKTHEDLPGNTAEVSQTSSNDHINVNTDNLATYSCTICSQNFSSKTIFFNHVSTHLDEEIYICDMCNMKFNRKSNLLRHIFTKHKNMGFGDEKIYICDVCKKKFNRKSNLLRHILTNHKNMGFLNLSSIRRVNEHHGKKSYNCDGCDKVLKSKRLLKEHLRVHTGEKPFKCELCNGLFKYSSGLRKHMNTHTKEKIYRCEICTKTFTTKYSLTMHNRIHTGERKYKCDMCDQVFRYSNSLLQHKRRHARGNIYGCPVCNERFPNIRLLHEHEKSHIDKKAYRCRDCDKLFDRKYQLESHKTVHVREKNTFARFAASSLKENPIWINIKKSTRRKH